MNGLARILQVARQSLRAAVRSRFAASLAALLALVSVALPSLVPGDGSVEGNLRILLAWAPGLATILLGAATLWAGCGALATEIEEGTWAGIASTRASRLQLWLGKWLGLVALDALLLATALGVCAVQARLRGLPADRLRPYAVVIPDERTFRDQAVEAARRMLADPQKAATATDAGTGAFPTNIADLAEVLLTDLREGPISFSAGSSFRWRFPVSGGHGLRRGEPARLRLEIVSPYGTAAQMNGRLAAYAESGADNTPLAERPIAPEDNREVWLDVPGERLDGVETVLIEFENTGAEDTPAALVEVVDGVRFSVPRGTFTGNLVRVWAVQLALLALLAAIGTACGAMFTRPVAVFAATAIAVMGLVSHAGFDEEPAHVHDHDAAEKPSAIMQFQANASRFLMHRIALCTQPVADAAAFDRLGDSILVETSPIFGALWLDGLALPVLLGALSALVLRRR